MYQVTNELESKCIKGGYIGDDIGDYYRGKNRDTRSLDYGSNGNTRLPGP